MQQRLKIAVVGLGAQGQKHIQAIRESVLLEIIAVCDIDQALVTKVSANLGCHGYTSVEKMLDAGCRPIMAVLAIPHHLYLDIIIVLASSGIHILKEKPAACSLDEAKQIQKIAAKFNVHIMVSVQRRFNENYRRLLEMMPLIGSPIHTEIQYSFTRKPRVGWRYKVSQGAEYCNTAVGDMGYHIIDLLIWYWGIPTTIKSITHSTVEDANEASIILFKYDHRVTGSATISRSHIEKIEKICLIGPNGSLILKNGALLQLDANNNPVSSFDTRVENPLKLQTEHFGQFILGKKRVLVSKYEDHLLHLQLLKSIAIDASAKLKMRSRTQFEWPIITKETEDAIIKQLHESISIYDKSGVVKEFEDKFAAYHQRKWSLLSNSGTSSLYAMFACLDLKPEDEILAPVYTFPATVSPLASFGARLVFCDCDQDGNIDPDEIERKVTSRTKAVVITHMWGIPCRMDEITRICKKNRIILLEDCSHAHGARYKGKLVGTFGSIGVWSLQGQKIITAGQGGILLCDDEELYKRALLHNEFNRRCWQEIDDSHPLHKYTSTGFGLNHKPHPLGVAIANQQFDHLDQWLSMKRKFAKLIVDHLSDLKVLKMPRLADTEPAWYAFVMQFNPKFATCTIEQFCQLLKSQNLDQIDRPSSTRPLYDLSLFNEYHDAISRSESYKTFISADNKLQKYPQADQFYANAIKMPVWVRPEDESIVIQYMTTIRRVAISVELQKLDSKL